MGKATLLYLTIYFIMIHMFTNGIWYISDLNNSDYTGLFITVIQIFGTTIYYIGAEIIMF